jgi:hypothetical protein
VRSLRGEARMSYQTNQGRVKATVRMMGRSGGQLRFDVVSPVDTPLSTLVCSSGRFALVDSQKNQHFHGPATPCNLARLLQVELRPADVHVVLGGGTPIIKHQSAKLSWDNRAGEEVLVLSAAKVVQTIRLDGRDNRWRLKSSELRDKSGKLLLKLAVSDYSKVSGVEIPKTIAVEQPLNKASLLMSFRKREINLKLPEIAFELPKAEGLPSQEVTCATKVKLGS